MLKKMIKIKKILFLFTFFVMVIVLSPAIVSSQSFSLENNLTLSLDPEFPRANQTISAKIESYIVDLNRAKISWYIDGELKEKLSGKKKISLITGSIGSSSSIKVVVETATETISKVFTIRPAEVEILWETKSATPPFYKGKALNSHETQLKIVAMPNFKINGKKVDPSTLVYKWRIGSKVFTDSSGYGKNVLLITGPKIFREDFIVLNVESLDKTLRAQSVATIRAIQPKILFYENNPLLGVLYKKAIGSEFNLRKEEATITAFPFFFSSAKEDASYFNYIWTMNGRTVPPQDKKNTITLRREGDNVGFANISLNVQNTKKRMGMQFAQNNFLIKFNNTQQSTQSIF